jgi:hypothetical protein
VAARQSVRQLQTTKVSQVAPPREGVDRVDGVDGVERVERVERVEEVEEVEKKLTK